MRSLQKDKKKLQREEAKREMERKEFLKQQAISKLRAKQDMKAEERRIGTQQSLRARRDFQLRYIIEEKQKWITKAEDITEDIFDKELELVGFWHEANSSYPLRGPIILENIPPDPLDQPFNEELPRVQDLVDPPPPVNNLPDPETYFPWLKYSRPIRDRVPIPRSRLSSRDKETQEIIQPE